MSLHAVVWPEPTEADSRAAALRIERYVALATGRVVRTLPPYRPFPKTEVRP